MDMFPTMQVDRARSQSVEWLGSKRKFWFQDGNRRLLFKADDRGTGEDWAEVVSCHLCKLLGLPHVEYELAAEYADRHYFRPGVICENMAPRPTILILGNQLLLAVDSNYPLSQRFKVRQHAVESVSDIVIKLSPPAMEWTPNIPASVQSALDVFAGYVMLDAWIGNQDRHHENWGSLWDRNDLRLAPTFDHGAALARNLLDSEREERLLTKDKNRTVTAFARRGRSAFYASIADTRPLELREAFRAFAHKVPKAASAWLSRLRQVKQDEVWGILDRVPAERMSDVARRFVVELLLTNQRRLLE